MNVLSLPEPDKGVAPSGKGTTPLLTLDTKGGVIEYEELCFTSILNFWKQNTTPHTRSSPYFKPRRDLKVSVPAVPSAISPLAF
jgi:hypothetical protein